MHMSRRFSLPFVAFALLALFVSCPAHGQEKTKLRLNLKAGQSYTIAMTMDQKITQTVAGNAQNIAQTIGMTFTLKPSKLDPDGTIHGTYTYDAVRVKMNAPGMVVDYDSATAVDGAVPNNPMAQTFAALVGQSLEVVMTPDGRVTDLKGADRLMEAVVNSVQLPPGARAGLEQQIKSQFGDEALKRQFEQMTAIYPEKPVGVGDAWTVEQRMNMGFPMVLKTAYTLKSLSGGKATADVEGTIETGAAAAADGEAAEGDAAPAPGQPATELSGTQAGTLVIDQATGWLTSGTMKQDIKGKVTVNAGGQKIEIPMTIKSDIKFEQPTE